MVSTYINKFYTFRKKGEKLDWMYDGQQTVDKEAYLLGKKIDKNIEVAKEEEKVKCFWSGMLNWERLQ